MMDHERIAALNGLTLRESVWISDRIDALCAELVERGFKRVTTWWDMARLADFNAWARSRKYHALLPVYDVDQDRTIRPDEAFWISCHDEHDHIKATIAVRLRELTSDLRDALVDGTLICPDRNLGFRGHFSGPLAHVQEMSGLRRIRGDVALPGAMWVDPDWRGSRISEPLFALSVVLAYKRWKPGHFVGLVELAKENPIGFKSYNFPHAHKFFVYTAPDETLMGAGQEIAVLTMSQLEARELFVRPAT